MRSVNGGYDDHVFLMVLMVMVAMLAHGDHVGNGHGHNDNNSDTI